MNEFINVFSAFLEIQTAMIVKFYEIILAMEEVQNMELTNV